MNGKEFTSLAEAVAFFEEKKAAGKRPILKTSPEGKHIVEWVEVSKPQLLEG